MNNNSNKKNIIILVSVSCALVILLIAGTLIYNSNAEKENEDKDGFVVNPARDESDVNEDYQNNENPSEPTMDSAETDEPVETV